MKNIQQVAANLMSLVLVLFVPMHVVAQDGTAVEPPVYSSSIIITEVQTGGASASDEFIELYNTGFTNVDLAGWQVRYVNAASASRETSLLATLEPAAGESLILGPRAYLVLRTATVILQDGLQSMTYTAKLSSADKAIALYRPDTATCELHVQDAVAWGTSIDGEGQAPPVAVPLADRLLRRTRNADGFYADTNHNDYDFVASSVVKSSASNGKVVEATPGADNTVINAVALPPATGAGSNLAPVAIDDCVVPDDPLKDNGQLGQSDESPPSSTEVPPAQSGDQAQPSLSVADLGLNAPQLSEILPNPASPLTDAEDEFVELYNPNDAPFDLSGFTLESGKRHYTFVIGTMLAPKEFKAFFAAQTHLSLPNSAGQILLLDPLGNVIGQTDSYGTAKDDYAWVLAAGVWQWTTKPTPNASNVIAAPLTKTTSKVTPAAKTSVKGAATTKATKATTKKATATAQTAMTSETTRSPLHPGVLALVGGLALLYGAYEYRSDVANRIHQFRVYRATRRENRQCAKGRRSD